MVSIAGMVLISGVVGGDSSQGGDLAGILLGVLKNPMILGILAGLPFSFIRTGTGFEFPFAITKSLGYRHSRSAHIRH